MDISEKNDLIEKLAKIEEGKVQKRFALENDGNFKHNIERLFNGSGDESSKFYAVDSSSRLSFLCFSSWIEKNGYVEIEIKGKGPVKFTQLYFEAKNKVIKSPSNVDVLLVSKKEDILLYLESKFTEYVRDADEKAGFSKGYIESKNPGIKELMKELVSKDIVSEYFDDKGARAVVSKNHPLTYPQGIKQMISHFIGVCKGPSLSDKDFNTISKLWRGAEHIYLGSVLYQFSDKEFDAYSKCHEELANVLNDKRLVIKADKIIKVIGKPFTYQELVKKNPLPKEVADYYKL
jgi:hypothetical protein